MKPTTTLPTEAGVYWYYFEPGGPWFIVEVVSGKAFSPGRYHGEPLRELTGGSWLGPIVPEMALAWGEDGGDGR